jgi:hypothetical protein
LLLEAGWCPCVVELVVGCCVASPDVVDMLSCVNMLACTCGVRVHSTSVGIESSSVSWDVPKHNRL